MPLSNIVRIRVFFDLTILGAGGSHRISLRPYLCLCQNSGNLNFALSHQLQVRSSTTLPLIHQPTYPTHNRINHRIKMEGTRSKKRKRTAEETDEEEHQGEGATTTSQEDIQSDALVIATSQEVVNTLEQADGGFFLDRQGR